jgi:uncharacterized protein YjbI with pentapeptide repeats
MPAHRVPAGRPRSRRSLSLIGGLFLLTALLPAGVAAAMLRDCSDIQPEPGAAMQRCDLSGQVIIGMDLHGIRLDAADLTGVNAGCDPDEPRTNLAGSRLPRATLVGALLCDAILDDALLRAADLRDAALEDATLTQADLTRAVLDGAAAGFAGFADARMSGASWLDGSAVGARFDRGDLSRSDLRGTNPRAARPVDPVRRLARLDGVDFTSADLTGADWFGATGLDTAIWSSTTCPDGTNSDGNGGTCVGH